MPSDPPPMPPSGEPSQLRASSLSRVQSQALARRRRGRNIAMLLGLVALVVLFYLITVVKMSHQHPTGGGPGASSERMTPALRAPT